MTTHAAGPSIRALIADDDDDARRQLHRALMAVWPGLRIVQAVDGIEAWDSFLEHEPEVCFLDVRMPGLTGIEVAQRIGDRAEVVLVMAANDRAHATLEADGVPHLIKPFEPPQVAGIVDTVQRQLEPDHPAGVPSLQHLLDRLAGQLRRPTPLEVVQADDGAHTWLLNVDDIVYFEGDARSTRAVSSDGEALIRTPLKELAARLDPLRFCQIQRHLLVNQRHILGTQQLDGGAMVLSLRERAKTLPVARHFQRQFQATPARYSGDDPA